MQNQRQEPEYRRNFGIKSKLVSFLLLLFLLSGVQACAQAEMNIKKQLELGNKYLDEMKYEEAVIVFSKVIEIDAKTWEAYSGAAKAYRGLGEEEKAAEILETALLLLEAGDTDAEMEYDAAYSVFLTEITKLYLTMADEIVEEDQEKALQYYGKLLEIDPDCEEAYQKITQLTVKKYPEDYLDFEDNYAYTSEQFEKCQSVLIKLHDIFLQSGIEGAENYVAEMTQVPGYTTDATCLIKTDFYHGRKAYYGEKDENGHPDGFGVALCDDGFNAQYFIGEWEKGQRVSGTLFSSSTYGEIGYYEGGWENDLPNGHGKMYDFFLDTFYEGDFTDGYFDGDFTIISYAGRSDPYSVHFTMGEGDHLENYEDGSWLIAGKIMLNDGSWINGVTQNPGYYYSAWGFPVTLPPPSL